MKISLYNNYQPWFYRVKKSDEVYTLENGVFDAENFAKKFNFDVSEFNLLNGKLKNVSFGDVLIIPPSSQYCHIVQPTETLGSIANLYNINVNEIKSLNNVKQVFIGEKLFL